MHYILKNDKYGRKQKKYLLYFQDSLKTIPGNWERQSSFPSALRHTNNPETSPNSNSSSSPSPASATATCRHRMYKRTTWTHDKFRVLQCSPAPRVLRTFLLVFYDDNKCWKIRAFIHRILVHVIVARTVEKLKPRIQDWKKIKINWSKSSAAWTRRIGRKLQSPCTDLSAVPKANRLVVSTRLRSSYH